MSRTAPITAAEIDARHRALTELRCLPTPDRVTAIHLIHDDADICRMPVETVPASHLIDALAKHRARLEAVAFGPWSPPKEPTT